MIPISGKCDSRFARVKEIFEANFANGSELGASVALMLDGDLVIDLWGGWIDQEKTKLWQEDTIVPVYSTSKTMAALCALILIDRGLLDPFAPVAKYWPEFAVNGKEKIEVRHIMSHTAGLSGWEQPVTVDDVYNWEKGTAHLAQQAPWWEPGTASGYHLVSYNHLVGGLIERVTGITPTEFFSQEISQPMGIDYNFGITPDIAQRISPMVPFEAPLLDLASLDPESVMMKTLTGPFFGGSAGTIEYLSHPLLMNGISNARGIVQSQAVVSHGGKFNGNSLLSRETIDLIFQQQSEGVDLILNIPISFGIGYALADEAWGMKAHSRTCWWAGMGGSRIVNFVDHGATFGYAMNKMSSMVGDPRSNDMIKEVQKVLEA